MADRMMFAGLLDCDASVEIGGRDVIVALEESGFDRPQVTVLLMVEGEPHEQFDGKLDADRGWAGTDVTPGDPPIVMVGGSDLLRRLQEFDGRQVALEVEWQDG